MRRIASNLTPRLAAIMAATALVLVSCSSSKEVNSPGISAATSGSSTSVGATSSVPASTDVPTTTAAAVDPLLLRSDGVGAHDYGANLSDVVDTLNNVLGAPTADTNTAYPTADGAGQYLTAEADIQYVAPVGRQVCWSNGFCAEFGGPDAGSLTFTGWTYSGGGGAPMSSTSGATVGTRWADVPSMIVNEGGCYSTGYGLVDDIDLTLLSSGVPFSEFDASGNYVSHLPDPADTTVLVMQAGDIPIFLLGDC